MRVDDALLDKLEKLSMIRIDTAKREGFKDELSEIIKKMNELQEVDTSNIILQENRHTPMREDCVIESNIREEILKQAPNVEDGYFIVPKIIG